MKATLLNGALPGDGFVDAVAAGCKRLCNPQAGM